jgi:SAM-dependent methyltransferase
MNAYNESFYERQSNETYSSSEVIVPLLLDLVGPRSVIDVGCGTGSWLRTFRERGIEDVRGFDGPWLDTAKLLIPQELFTRADLDKPLNVDRRFDLAMSLEVAEHLKPESADGFVESLTSMSDVVVFSAAIPFQGGFHHLNEQWPEYWAQLFEKRDYQPIDCLRLRLWNQPNVHYWYRQNVLVYVKRAALERYPKLAEIAKSSWGPLPFVHPALYIPGAAFLRHMGVTDVTRLWFRVFGRTVSKRVKAIFSPGVKSSAPLLPPRPVGAPRDLRIPSRTH